MAFCAATVTLRAHLLFFGLSFVTTGNRPPFLGKKALALPFVCGIPCTKKLIMTSSPYSVWLAISSARSSPSPASAGSAATSSGCTLYTPASTPPSLFHIHSGSGRRTSACTTRAGSGHAAADRAGGIRTIRTARSASLTPRRKTPRATLGTDDSYSPTHLLSRTPISRTFPSSPLFSASHCRHSVHGSIRSLPHSRHRLHLMHAATISLVRNVPNPRHHRHGSCDLMPSSHPRRFIRAPTR